jgi:hypothetical protein
MARKADILKAIDQTPTLKRRTPLELWMHDHHDAFAKRLETRVVDWSALAEVFALGGLTDRYGNRPKAETARKTWQRVRKKVAAERSKTKPVPVVRAPPEFTPQRDQRSSPQSTDDILSMLKVGRQMPEPVNPKKERS